jgi:BirA family transcriptional regulator, biotin operon repressor / biotin---[acetyl-CoA-carboxylase] ligase
MKFKILHYDTVRSTNDIAKDLAMKGAAEGTVVSAQYQTQGRGRFRRKWRAPRGSSMLVSIVLRPALPAGKISILTHQAAKSVQAVLVSQGLGATLKRPNDVLIKGRKVAGILTEASGKGRRVQYVVVGIGLNVNTRLDKLLRRTTSIYQESGKKQDINRLLRGILSEFNSEYRSIMGRNDHA